MLHRLTIDTDWIYSETKPQSNTNVVSTSINKLHRTQSTHNRISYVFSSIDFHFSQVHFQMGFSMWFCYRYQFLFVVCVYVCVLVFVMDTVSVRCPGAEFLIFFFESKFWILFVSLSFYAFQNRILLSADCWL